MVQTPFNNYSLFDGYYASSYRPPGSPGRNNILAAQKGLSPGGKQRILLERICKGKEKAKSVCKQALRGKSTPFKRLPSLPRELSTKPIKNPSPPPTKKAHRSLNKLNKSLNSPPKPTKSPKSNKSNKPPTLTKIKAPHFLSPSQPSQPHPFLPLRNHNHNHNHNNPHKNPSLFNHQNQLKVKQYKIEHQNRQTKSPQQLT